MAVSGARPAAAALLAALLALASGGACGGADADTAGLPIVMGGGAEEDAARTIIAAHLALRPGMTVVDAGAGRGAMTKALACGVHPGGRVIATDIDPRQLASIRAFVATEDRSLPCSWDAVSLRLVTWPGDTGVDDLPADSVDLVIMLNVLTFRPEDRGADLAYLWRFLRVLKPGGRFLYYIDWTSLPDYERSLAALFHAAGFAREVERLPMPAGVPPRALGPHGPQDALIEVWRGLIAVFRKPG